MEQQQPERREGRSFPERKGQKRKLEEGAAAAAEDREISASTTTDGGGDAILNEIAAQVSVLNSAFSWQESDRAAAKRATQVLAELAKNAEDLVNVIVDGGAVPALMTHLQAPPYIDGDLAQKPFEHEVEKGSAFALGLLAIKPEYQKLIVDKGALPHLVNLLKRSKDGSTSRAVNSVIRRAADAITNLAHENSSIKTRVSRLEGGIPPLVDLLEFSDSKVQRAAAGALRTLAFKNDDNKNQIVDCSALPTLILMLGSEDAAIHYEAVGVIGNLVHSSPNIKKEVLSAGALQPVIGLLSSCCPESQREAALLLGQFASTDSDCKVHIVQRGAVRPLIEMLQSPDVQLKEMSAFALGRLAQDSHNQAGIAHSGGLGPLLKLLDSRNGSLQHNAAFALYGLADNEDNVSDFIRVGGIQKLQDGEFIVQATKDCVSKTLKRLEEKIHGRVLRHLLYLMRISEKSIQRRVALALAHLWLELLLGLLGSTNTKQQLDGAAALYKLANKSMALSPVEAAPPSPTQRVYLGEQYVNSATLSDVTFLVEGRRFYAHRICLLASSDAFRAMFDGGYREKDARDIEIPNIKWEVFELMMRFIYTGSVDITIEISQDLLRAADQYLLEGLKRLCEYTIAQDITLENIGGMYDLSEAFHAMSLRQACILFILEHFDKLSTMHGQNQLVQRTIPEIREYFCRALTKSTTNLQGLRLFSRLDASSGNYPLCNAISDLFTITLLMADILDSRPHTFSIKLWPPSLPTRQALIERMTNNLSSKTIFTDKFGSLTKDQAMENAKRIEDVAFSTANLQFEREPDGDGGSAVQLYAKECSKMILEVLKKGPVCKAEQVSSASPCKETVFDISKDKRAFIEAEEAEELLKPLKEPGNVYTKICFSNRSFGLGAARVAEPILASLKDQLKVVDLSDFVAGRPEVEALEVMNIFSSALEGSVLSSLNLSDNALGEKGVRAFGTLLKSLSSLEELYLMNDGISKEAAQAVSELIPSTEKLRVLHFHNNMTGDEGAVAISEVVKRSPLLENFRCSSTRVGEGGGIALSEALENCTLMEKLDLRDNMFGTEAGVSLSKTLSRFKHLAEVYLSYLNLEDEGAIAIANALKDSAAPIEVLEMAGNDITVEAASAIAACVEAKQDLNKLNLSENELKDEGCLQIAKSVEEEHLKLQYIDMSNNYIRRAGARALAQVVVKKEGFKLLNIDGNIISEEGIEEVKEILKKTPEVLGALDDNDPDGEEEEEDDEEDEEKEGEENNELESKLKKLEVNEDD
uniref:BTB domain-containing protein n=1 Tax=Brassica oleracea TaxID=3712 RepID=A0A3P6E5F7_BRAOL|nr:unnamed protein product [Brassica oleracea]